MILQRVMGLAAAIAAVVAAVVISLTASALTLYAVARTWLPAAGAAAVVAAAFALLSAGVAVWAVRKTPPPAPAEDVSLLEQLLQLAKARPMVALGAAAAAVTVLIRNPTLLTGVLSAVMAGGGVKAEPK